ncbi:UPF0280 family protein [Frigidibacter sp. ROC022]|uniref:UPF0280 family protein n=1 Tax=Frigidibacter sp. ROC022 TaxID=2971796 RepID=UPI00215B3E78|nr:UPF0280 family protein [Frigidibacter sp. ROC022]MCR8725009.1 UPF0280 family protein [Frigidibacter sp. ROC022]
MSVQAAILPGGRLHLQQGPIDLVIEAMPLRAGPAGAAAVRAAYDRARDRFDGLLQGLAAELPALRSPEPLPLQGPVARVMGRAVAPYRAERVTPMAAVAGAVAEAVLAALVGDGAGLGRAYVNNGGDIALWLGAGQRLTAALAGSADRVTVRQADAVRGIATSGWRGRSFSLGIADAVTVLAGTAAAADVAATMIGNRVDLPGHPAIRRRPACTLQCDSDLGARMVTVAVGPLQRAEAEEALAAGAGYAEALCRRGLIAGAALMVQGRRRIVGQALLTREPEETYG